MLNQKIDEEELYKFVFETEDGKKIDCELLFSFYIKNVDKQYWLITDNTYDNEGNLKVYAYYNNSQDQTLKEISDKEELKIIEEIYINAEKKVGE